MKRARESNREHRVRDLPRRYNPHEGTSCTAQYILAREREIEGSSDRGRGRQKGRERERHSESNRERTRSRSYGWLSMQSLRDADSVHVL